MSTAFKNDTHWGMVMVGYGYGYGMVRVGMARVRVRVRFCFFVMVCRGLKTGLQLKTEQTTSLQPYSMLQPTL